MPKSQAANAIAHIRCVPCAAIVTIDFGVQKHANMCESLGCKYLAEHCKIIWKSIGPYLRDLRHGSAYECVYVYADSRRREIAQGLKPSSHMRAYHPSYHAA